MLCFLRSFASVTWRSTSNFSTECDNERLTNASMLRELRLGKSEKAILLSIIFLLYSFIPIPLFAQLIFGDGFEDEIVAVASVPDAPTLVSATPGDESVTLSFTPNFDGGSEITGYIATCGDFGQPGTSSPITINGLTNGVTYTCSVLAANVVGNSDISNTKTATPVSPIQASITKFEVTTNKDPQPVSCGDTNITFEWEATGADRCFGSWAKSETNPEGELDSNINQASGILFGSETVLFEDLALTQSFTLGCKNDGDETVVQQSKDVEVQAPCLTTRLESWKDMFTREWHGPKNYRPYVRISGDKNLAIKFNTGPVFEETRNTSPITITGLQRGNRYSCSVIANNASGESSASSNLVFFNPVETVPEAPTLDSVEPGDKSAVLNFTSRPDLFAIDKYTAKCGGITKIGYSSPITVSGLANGETYLCSVTATNVEGESEISNKEAVEPEPQQQPTLFVTSAKGKGQFFQASPGSFSKTASAPSAPNLNPAELGHLAVELTFDAVSTASSYTASCKISTFGGLGTIEFGGTRGRRLLAVSENMGDFQVAEECRQYQYLSDWLIWKTEGSDREGTTCDLKPDTDYYWNITFTDGVNTGTSSCAGTPCQTYIRVSNTEYVN